MPSHCMVPRCDHYRKRKKERVNISYHRFPTDVERCKEWLRAIKHAKYDENTPTSILGRLRVCSLHFSANDYERDMQSELMGGTLKKLLKTSAVPTASGSDIGHGEGEPREKQSRIKTEEQTASTSTATVSVPTCGPETQPFAASAATYSIPEVVMISPSVLTPAAGQPSVGEYSGTASQPSVYLDTSFSSIKCLDRHDGSFCPEAGFTVKSSLSDDETEKTDWRESKAIVHQTCVLELFKMCQTCGSPINGTNVSIIGAQMKVTWGCIKGHFGTWKSSPDV